MRNNYILPRPVTLLAGFILAILLFSSCKKDQTSQGGYLMKFDVNGKTVEFTTQASLVAAFSNTGSQYLGVFTGYDANSNMSLSVFDNKAIVPGTFSGYSVSNGALVGILITYQDDSGTVYVQSTTTSSDAVINISEITATTVRGTFSGTLETSGKQTISVTNGQFFVWRAN